MTNETSSQLGAEIAQQIIAHARRNGLEPGEKLTERALAAEFGVSRSPVRVALKLLAARGVVSAKATGGYVLAKLNSNSEENGDVPASVVEQIYLTIIKERFEKKLPEDFTEADLMRRFDVSRAMLRNALLRMTNEGLVKRRRGHGWHFLPFIDTGKADWESYEFRLAIEPSAIRSTNYKVDEERLKRCRTIHAEMLAGMISRVSGASFYELNVEFHEMLVEFSGNRYFLQSIKNQNRLRRAVEYESFVWSERMRSSCQEHINIMDTLLAGDIDWAAMLMTHHLKMSQHGSLPFKADKKQDPK